ncbi:MAG: hypothetical protein AAF573_01660 [Bacteroidota bacterium]
MNSISFQSSWIYSQSKIYCLLIGLFTFSLGFQSCGPSILRDSFSVEQNDIIKTDAIALMKRAGKSYSSMEGEVNDLKSRIDTLIQHEQDRGEANSKTVKMWELMMNPNEKLLGGFLNRWENEGKLNGPFIKEIAKQVSTNFDKIIKYEKKKKKP